MNLYLVTNVVEAVAYGFLVGLLLWPLWAPLWDRHPHGCRKPTPPSRRSTAP
jgi:hypothetical protein